MIKNTVHVYRSRLKVRLNECVSTSGNKRKKHRAAFNDQQKLKIFWDKVFLLIRKKLPS